MTTYQGFQGGFPANQPFHPGANRVPPCLSYPARDPDNPYSYFTRKQTFYKAMAISLGSTNAAPSVFAVNDILQLFLIPSDSVLESIGVQVDGAPTGLTFDITLASAQSLSGQKYTYNMASLTSTNDQQGCPILCPAAPSVASAAVPTGFTTTAQKVIVRDFVTHPFSGNGDIVQAVLTGLPSGTWKLSQVNVKLQMVYKTLFEW